MDLLILSRVQFAVTIMFHYIYPPMSIGLGLIIVIMESMYMITKKPLYHQMTKFWVKMFGLNFVIGAATGIVMEFEFGTNWSTYSRYVGDVFGPALAAEGIFAFFLESGFLAVLLFGRDKVSSWMYWLSALLVCLGAHFSAVWIIVAGSWMQTPAGFHIVGHGMTARAQITDFWAMVFNPSSMERLFHVLLASWITGAFFVLSVSAYYLLKKRHIEFAKVSMRVALAVALISVIGEVITGRISAETVAQYQPTKLAVMEGHFPANEPAGMYLFGYVDEKSQEVKYGVKISGLISFLMSGDAAKPVAGIKSFKKEDLPPINIVFQTYHLMIAIGSFLFALTVVCLIYFWRGKLFQTVWLLKVLVLSILLPQIANQLGWMTAEIGRQPWIVYGLLRTSEGLSKAVTVHVVLASLIMFTFVYLLLFVLYIYLFNSMIQHGPDEAGKGDAWI